MEARLIMLQNPILVSDEEIKEGDKIWYKTLRNQVGNSGQDNLDKKYFSKIIAGLIELPKLDLSLIANGIGWVDVEAELKKVYKEFTKDVHQFDAEEYINSAEQFGVLELHKMIFKAAQSLNERKYSEEDMRKAIKMAKSLDWQRDSDGDKMFNYSEKDIIQSLLKPKEYLVEYIKEGNKIIATKIVKQ